MEEMFYEAIAFNQNLCAWKDKNFPYDEADAIFEDSGCEYKMNPDAIGRGPFCGDLCGLPMPTRAVSLTGTQSLCKKK